jgi:hypothetical protein
MEHDYFISSTVFSNIYVRSIKIIRNFDLPQILKNHHFDKFWHKKDKRVKNEDEKMEQKFCLAFIFQKNDKFRRKCFPLLTVWLTQAQSLAKKFSPVRKEIFAK